MMPPWAVLGIIVVLVGYVLFTRTHKEKQVYLRQQAIDDQCASLGADETIFVSIPCFAPDIHTLVYSIIDLFERAHCPFRVFVGICQDTSATISRADIMELYSRMSDLSLHDFSDNIRVYSTPFSDKATARSLIEKHLYRGEKYLLQIDSHTLFVDDWDEICINQLRLCGSAKPVLSMLPTLCDPSYTKKEKLAKPTFLRLAHNTLPVVLASEIFVKRPLAPVPALFVSSCFMFCYGERIREVPYDSETNFMGEDYSMSARLYTTGYDLFHPMGMIVTMTKLPCPSYYESKTLGLLGTVRTLQAYENWCGVKVLSKTLVVAPTAFAGMNVVQPESEQIIQKYGSRKAYLERCYSFA